VKRTTVLVIALAVCMAATGCAYRGAVYSSYQQLALDVRATTDSSTPVRVNFGYDRGVGAWVPKLNSQGEGSGAAAKNATATNRGEAVSLISKDDIRSTVTPPVKGTTYKVVVADSAFITGMAANVAAAPDGMEVHVVAPEASGGVETMDAEQAATLPAQVKIQVNGDPGERIAAALSSAQVFDVLQALFDRASQLDHAGQDAVFDSAAQNMSTPFKAEYKRMLDKGQSPRRAFDLAKIPYVSGTLEPKTTPEERRARLIAALSDALNKER
jgi:hypothetical protein